ncbi:MAG TPA: metalloregulator ArsR/SmtB family transcription factor [Candidatus Agrococcus pullicola]|uniref:Metalloregulator ArsR/SmtB family transcription factor n=1 Tax=Candidatus Agrococcus pullicola TaxID=2838429 RepID=A0A9D1YY87_9MICO|nr:metalloregulator ArsR/SmtB family transcription factor [Candidatus Agrococcus pullicola]
MLPSHKRWPLYEVKANLFKGLSHPARIRVLELLAESEELTVSRLIEETGLEASHLSQHLAVLRRHKLVASERRGSHVFYHLAHPDVAEMLAVARRLLIETLASSGVMLAGARDLPEISRASQ